MIIFKNNIEIQFQKTKYENDIFFYLKGYIFLKIRGWEKSHKTILLKEK